MECSQHEAGRGATLFVGNLPPGVTEQRLAATFAAHGVVASARIIGGPDYGRRAAFAFVDMSNETEADAAVIALNGRYLDGRLLIVRKAES